MVRFILTVTMSTLLLNAGIKHLTLNQALSMLNENNLEVKVSRYEETMKKYDIAKVEAKNFGTLDLELTALRSNDPGNVFGFKMQSRDATFGDFGFDQFLGGFGQAMADPNTGNPDFNSFAANMANPDFQKQLLNTKPIALNYPKARNHFLTKLTYKIPLYTGGMLTNYKKITQKLYNMSKLDTQKVLATKRFELKKTFYGVGVLNSMINKLSVIEGNIRKLKRIIKEMEKEGYAVETDYLEVDAKLAEVQAMMDEVKLNRKLAYYFISFLLNTEVSSIIPPKHNPKVPIVTKEIVEAQSLDIAKARLGRSITRNAIEVEKSKFKPKIGAFAEYGNANDKLFKYSKKGFYTVGVQVKWNLFNGGADKASLEKAKVNYLKVATQVKLAKQGMWLKARKLKSEIRIKNSLVRSYQRQYRFAHKVYETYKAKYREGIAPITEVLIKESKEIEMLMKLLKAKNDRNEKVLALQKLINR